MNSELSIVWDKCLSILRTQFDATTFNAWLRLLKLAKRDGIYLIIANNNMVADVVRNKYIHAIGNIISNALQMQVKVEVMVDDDVAPQENTFKHNEDNQIQHNTRLNSYYNFESFVCGNSNQLAYAIGLHITQQPGHKHHNPLFIYGGVGLGKTHLMQAIGNEIYQKSNYTSKIRYLHANEYIQDVVNASIKHSFDKLKSYYNSLDLLLMDDIQFIAGDKTKTQEEFFYTFNTLLDQGKQIIMTCDTYHKNISNLNERLTSRFASGLSVEIQAPELEMRAAILQRKAEQHAVILDEEVAWFIAQNIKSNVRELEGALNKVIYHAQFSNKSISLLIAKEALIDVIALDKKNISVDDIQKVICDFYRIKLSDLLSKNRKQSMTRPRQIGMSLARQLTQQSLPSIGEYFGGRDHTTVIHAQRTVAQLRKTDTKIEREYNLLLQMLVN